MGILDVPAGSPGAGSVAVTSVTGLGTGVQTALQQSANGTGSIVLSGSPSLTTPNLDTPAAVNLLNGTNLPVATGVSGLGTNVATALAANNPTGTGALVLNNSPALVTPNLGTPSAGTLTSCSGLPIAGIAGTGTGVAGALAANVTGTGGIVLSTNPTVTLANATGLPVSTGLAGAGTGVTTALGQAVTGTGGVVLSTNAALTTPNLGTPSAATLTNATGLPIATGVSGLGTGVATALAAASTGTGGVVRATSPTIATPTISGTVTSYNGVTTAAFGIAVQVARADFLTQGANVAPTTIYAVPAGQGGRYRVTMNTVLVTPDGASSTLPNTTVSWTDADSSGTPSANIGATSTGNTTSTVSLGTIVIYAKAGTNISIQTNSYASGTAGAMKFNARYLVDYLGA